MTSLMLMNLFYIVVLSQTPTENLKEISDKILTETEVSLNDVIISLEQMIENWN